MSFAQTPYGAVIIGVLVAALQLTLEQLLFPARHRRRPWGRAALVGCGVAVILIAIQLIWPPWPELYRLRVTLAGRIHPELSEVQIATTCACGHTTRLPDGWLVEIRRDERPEDGRVGVTATHPQGYWGVATIMLARDANPQVAVALTLREAHVRGSVEDGSGHALVGVRVWVKGYDTESVLTGEGGGFLLPAHVGENQPVIVHAEKVGFVPWDQLHLAGDAAMTIRMVKTDYERGLR